MMDLLIPKKESHVSVIPILKVVWQKISGDPSELNFGSISLNAFFNDSSILYKSLRLTIFADDNTLLSSAKTVENLISILESESETTIKWLKIMTRL